ncbi:hypothetical protein S40285_08043 [Stachybotrys chlorohalonatus IBT 40285]|uniref:Mitochondrial thiamine pyrophosphate carrier 1 n=1 Tax=Stachybotrys chlorohalonatus (strain IBT 40285) TaxID=1283841 RepID=A0A084Q8I3_STAC4|nr:hypothetical protein S40285_08043 [Stachybotrys chlorohalonata IBT 40285]
MSADFWAGYLSGAVGIAIGNPLDVVKVRLQASGGPQGVEARFQTPSNLIKGTAAPILGYGALNSLLFVTYNRSQYALNRALSTKDSLWATWGAGALGGLATWAVSTPTELVKCRAQLSAASRSSWTIAQRVWRTEGIRGFYFGGAVTALRDSIGYGFYFWSYELATRYWPCPENGPSPHHETLKVLACGGLAGVVTWASVFPLDVVKTRVQTQPEMTNSLHPRAGAMQIASDVFKEGGIRPFFRGLTVCSVRAFVVNAVQWAVYEWTMHKLGHGRERDALST